LLQRRSIAQKSDGPLSGLKLLLQVPVWTVFISHLTQNSQVYFNDWLTFFYTDYLGISPDLTGLCLSIAALVELPARAATKSLPEYLSKRGYTLLHSRKLMSVQGFAYHMILCAVFGALIQMEVKSVIAFTMIFALCKLTQAFHSGGYFANYLDVTQAHVGLLTGAGNTLASLSGIFVPRFIAVQLEHDSTNWLPIAAAGIVTNIVAISWVCIGMSTNCLDEVQPCAKVTHSDKDKGTPQELSRFPTDTKSNQHVSQPGSKLKRAFPWLL